MINEETFSLADIEDVRVLLKVDGNHYSIIPLDGIGQDVATAHRVAVFQLLLQTHSIVIESLEEIKKIRETL